MPRSSVLQWRDGAGWLVLAGGGDFHDDAVSEVDSTVLRRTIADAPLAYLWSAGDIERADRHLEYLSELGGRTGYLLDIVSETTPALIRQLSEAGIVLLADGDHAEKVRSALRGEVLDAIAQAYANGATIYALGRMAAGFAAWMPIPQLGLKPALGWLENALVAAPYTPDDAPKVQKWLHDGLPGGYAIGIGAGSALALSPHGEVEIWGARQVTILLGQNLTSP